MGSTPKEVIELIEQFERNIESYKGQGYNEAQVRSEFIDPPFNSNRNYEVFWGETKEKRAFDDRC